MVRFSLTPRSAAGDLASALTVSAGTMSIVLAAIGVVKWPVTLGVTLLTLGLVMQGTLSVVAQHIHPSSGRIARASPVIIRMPDPVIVAARQVETRLSMLSHGRALTAGVTTPRSSFGAGTPTMRVTSSGLVVRSHPLATSAQVGVLARGDTVEVHGTQRGWMLVSAPHETPGWVFGKYLATAIVASSD
jgi:hypothetical protein